MKKGNAIPAFLPLLFLLSATLPPQGYAETKVNPAADTSKSQKERDKGGTAKTSEKGRYTVALTIEEKELIVGANKLRLVVRDNHDARVTGAEIAVTPWMPAGGHGVWEKPVVTERGEGNYRVENVVLVRSGHWDLRVSVKKGAEEDRVVFSFPVGLDDKRPQADSGKPRGKYVRTVVNYNVPDVTLLNQDGDKIKLRSYLDPGKPVMIDFIYTTCTTICPILSAGFSSIRDELGKGANAVRLVSISIDPDRDRPDRMKDYLSRFNSGEGWDFLTGSREDIALVLKAFDASVVDKMYHNPLYLLRGPHSGEWVRIYGLIGTSDLMRELRRIENK